MLAHAVSRQTRLTVGIFSCVGVGIILWLTMLVNGHPYWWRQCQLVNIRVDDATGLKSKSPVRSLGIDIGYLQSVALTESQVILGICITEKVQVLVDTKAYIRADGFLGDKFVELRPVKYIGSQVSWSFFPSAYAADQNEIPVGTDQQDVSHLVGQVHELVQQVTDLAGSLKEAIRPDDLRKTMQQLNRAVENVSKTIAPEGGLTQTAQRSLAKLEDAIEQMRSIMVRINKGEGSVGMLLNNPVYANELQEVIVNVNKLLTKVNAIRFQVDVGAISIPAYDGSRAWFHLGIWPRPTRYYLAGVGADPRGTLSTQIVKTTTASGIQSVQTDTLNKSGAIFSFMLGWLLCQRIDLSLGMLYSDGALSGQLLLGPEDDLRRYTVRNDIYFHGNSSIDDRITLSGRVIGSVYVQAAVESLRFQSKFAWSVGASIRFDDEDMKLLFALK